MNFDLIVEILRTRIPGLLAAWVFGSRATGGATTESDLDLAVLVEGYADPLLLFDLAARIAETAGCEVDLVDLRASSTVMQHQVLTTGTRLWRRDSHSDLWEAAMLTEKMHLDEARAGLIADITRRGTVYGR